MDSRTSFIDTLEQAKSHSSYPKLLDLSGYTGYFIDPGEPKEPFIQALKSCPNVETLDLSFVHPFSLESTTLRLFVDNLPKLKEIRLNFSDLNVVSISGELLCQIYAKGIMIQAGPDLLKYLQDRLTAYLNRAGQEEFAKQIASSPDSLLNPSIMQPAKFAQVLNVDSKREATDFKYRAASEAQETLIDDYKNGRGPFNTNSRWCKEGPKNPEDFAPIVGNSAQDQKEIFTLYLVITKLNLWDQLVDKPKGLFSFLSNLASANRETKLNAMLSDPALNTRNSADDQKIMAMSIMKEIANKGNFLAFKNEFIQQQKPKGPGGSSGQN